MTVVMVDDGRGAVNRKLPHSGLELAPSHGLVFATMRLSSRPPTTPHLGPSPVQIVHLLSIFTDFTSLKALDWVKTSEISFQFG